LLPVLPLAFLLVLQVVPALHVMALGFAPQISPADWWAPWTDAYLRNRMLWSLLQAGATCLLVFVLGLPVGWVLARFEFAGRMWVLRLLMLPFVVPTLVAAMGVLALADADLQGTPWLLLFGNVFFNLCVVVRAVVDALEQVSASRVAVARTLGADPWRAFVRVEWPSVAPWVMSALCLVFLYCFSGFGLALVLGGQEYATVEVEIYTLVAHELQLQQAGILAVWVVAIAGLVAYAYARMERNMATPAKADRIARIPPMTKCQRWALGCALTVIGLVCAAPMLAIAWHAVRAGPAAWAVLLQDETWDALWNTVRFSALAVAIATVVGVLHALAAQRLLWMRTLVYLPFVVSPVFVAFGLLLAYPQWAGGFWVMVGGYALLASPFVAKSVAARLDSLPVNYSDAARTLGATPWRCFVRVTLPLLRGALRRGVAFAAATAVGEFAVTLFLARPEWATLTTLIYQHLGRPGAANRDAAMVLASALMGLTLLAFVLIETKLGDADA
jgi:thiamine transport system permease protein